MTTRLFKREGARCLPIITWTAPFEADLHGLFDMNLDSLLGVRLIAREYAIDQGRIDTIGLDEFGGPVIIEYKRTQKDNVINQALFYLHWLETHKAEFEKLCQQTLGIVTQAIDWSAARIICVAERFNDYDRLAIEKIHSNIDLVGYALHGDELLEINTQATRRLQSYRGVARRLERQSAARATRASNDSPKLTELTEFIQSAQERLNQLSVRQMDGGFYLSNPLEIGRAFLTRTQCPRIKLELFMDPEEMLLDQNNNTRPMLDVARRTKLGFEVTIFDIQSRASATELLELVYEAKQRAFEQSY